MSDAEDRHLHLQELTRRVSNLLRVGTIEQADYSLARYRVRLDALLTGWLPWGERRAGGDRSWWPPEVGEQVLVACPMGDPAQAVILCALYQTAHPAPAASADIRRVDFGNGAWVEHDRATGNLTLRAMGDIDIEAVGAVRIQGARIDLNPDS